LLGFGFVAVPGVGGEEGFEHVYVVGEFLAGFGDEVFVGDGGFDVGVVAGGGVEDVVLGVGLGLREGDGEGGEDGAELVGGEEGGGGAAAGVSSF